MTKILHVSDLHFGVHSVPEQIAAIERLISANHYDVVAVSGDLSQRARDHEFERARAFLDRADAHSRTIAVPGNHDITWWRAPLGLLPQSWTHAKWRHYLGRAAEPVLRVPGATVVGVNTAHGVTLRTLTKRPRDVSVIGDLRDEQIARVAREFANTAPGDARVVVMHHNPVAGEISRRFGLKHSAYVLEEFAKLGVNLILCGHDHQEAVHHLEHTNRGLVVSIAGTPTTRTRGKRPAGVNAIDIDETHIAARILIWDGGRGEFVAGAERRWASTRGR